MDKTALAATAFFMIFFATTAGALAALTLSGAASKKHGAALDGFSAGIMVAASFFSLILPSIGYLEPFGRLKFIPLSISFLLGAAIFVATDFLAKKAVASPEDLVVTAPKKGLKTFIAMTVHNVPEGLVVGFAFGGACADNEVIAALLLAVGIAVQNFPEGAAVAMPMLAEGKSKLKSLFFGVLSGAVEPLAAAVGFAFSSALKNLLPVFMAFSAGTMVFVVISEMLPGERSTPRAVFFTLGFAVMMALDVAL
ncbi:MAG: ZIP family metal transporter [Clostridia bacterium]|nr:ZIP family metal transporter [Clostridia bacterium]